MRSRIGKRPRQFLVFLHVAVSVGWMGAGAANVVLALTAAYTPAADVRRVCYVMIEQIDVFVVIPLAFAALISGVLLCLDLSRDNLPLSRSPVGGGRACGRYRRPGPPLRPPVADRSQGCNTTLVQPFSRLSKFR